MSATRLIKGCIFPGVLLGSIVAFERLLSGGIDPGLALLGVTVANLALIALLEVVLPLRRDWAWFRDRQVVNDLIHGALLSIVGPRLAEAVLVSVIAAGAASIAAASGGGVWPTGWPLWLQLALAIVILDFVEWLKHWGYHHWAPMWAIHALHHSPDKMHVTKAARLHFLEATIRFAIITAPLLMLGAGPELILWYAALLNFIGNLNHSNVDMPLPGFLHYLLATPQVHRLHHEIDPQLGRSNLSPFTMLPDLLFGTFRHPDKFPLRQVGIENNPIPGNLLAQIAAPFIWPILARRKRNGGLRRSYITSSCNEDRPSGLR